MWNTFRRRLRRNRELSDGPTFACQHNTTPRSKLQTSQDFETSVKKKKKKTTGLQKQLQASLHQVGLIWKYFPLLQRRSFAESGATSGSTRRLQQCFLSALQPTPAHLLLQQRFTTGALALHQQKDFQSLKETADCLTTWTPDWAPTASNLRPFGSQDCTDIKLSNANPPLLLKCEGKTNWNINVLIR